eukprot:scaffold1699_cov114-Isochrysis_galbana.AAC.2
MYAVGLRAAFWLRLFMKIWERRPRTCMQLAYGRCHAHFSEREEQKKALAIVSPRSAKQRSAVPSSAWNSTFFILVLFLRDAQRAACCFEAPAVGGVARSCEAHLPASHSSVVAWSATWLRRVRCLSSCFTSSGVTRPAASRAVSTGADNAMPPSGLWATTTTTSTTSWPPRKPVARRAA